jgi:hypothetical protein
VSEALSKELAERTRVGEATIARGELGANLRGSSIRRLAEYFGVQPSDLMGAEEERR